MRTLAELQARTLEWAADLAPSDPSAWRIWIRTRAADIRYRGLVPHLNFEGAVLIEAEGDLPKEIVDRALAQSQREYDAMLAAQPEATGPGPVFEHSDEDPPDEILDQMDEESRP